MNPFLSLKLDDDTARRETAREASRFVRSGLASIAEWRALDEDVQEAILLAREVVRLEDAQARACIALDPATAMAEFSRPLDGGAFAARLQQAIVRADFAKENPDATVVSLSDLSAEQAEEIGVTVDDPAAGA